jgi:hypothetical protein
MPYHHRADRQREVLVYAEPECGQRPVSRPEQRHHVDQPGRPVGEKQQPERKDRGRARQPERRYRGQYVCVIIDLLSNHCAEHIASCRLTTTKRRKFLRRVRN